MKDMTLADVEARFIGTRFFPIAIGDRVDATQNGVVRACVRLRDGAPVVAPVGRNQRAAAAVARLLGPGATLLAACQ